MATGKYLLMDKGSHEVLEKRVGRLHLRQRLGIETDREAKVFGQGINFFHPENWYSMHSVIRNTLRILQLHGRGKKNALKIETNHNNIYIKNLAGEFEGFRILHISDLHIDMNPEMPDALIRSIGSLDYDLCVMTGDFRARTTGAYESTLTGMAQVCAHISKPVYGVLGNHDTIRMVPGLEEMGIRLLMNESVSIARQGAVIYMAGVDDPHYYLADNMEKACYEIPYESISILLSHSPELYQHAAHAGFNLMLCGHTHGGQICLPGGIPILVNARCPRKYCNRSWKYHDLTGYTSIGSGVSIVDVRINCPPEITIHHLHRAIQ